MHENFLFLKSYYEALQTLPEEESLKMFKAVVEYGMEEKVPNFDGYLWGLFLLIKPNIDAGLKRYEAKSKNGKRGGAPVGNQNAKKKTDEQKQAEPKT